jgi:hypothetical protein
MSQQTAVEFYKDQLYLFFQGHTKYKSLYEIFEDALKIEIEQKTQFADQYADAVMGGCMERAEEYYNETYNK